MSVLRIALAAAAALPQTTAGLAHAQHSTPDGRLEPYVGAYRVLPSGTMSLSRVVHGENTVYLFTDFTDGWRGSLVSAGGDTFTVSPRGDPAPTIRARVVLSRTVDGEPRLELHVSDQPMRVGTLLPLRIDAVVFRNDTTRLAGEVILPPGRGPHPGIVFVHGSGPATRDDYREWSYYFAANGIATLIYDKRGAGRSTGDYRQASFHDLAADAAAALRHLRSRPEVNPSAVGLSGGSQGAWVAPITATLDQRLGFLILTGGGPITPAEQETYRRARIVQDSGYTKAEVDLARSVVSLYFDYLRGGEQGSPLAADVADSWARHAGAPWFPLLDLPSRDPTVSEWPEGRRRFAAELHFDATRFMRALGTPTLAILGAEDQGFPTLRTAESYRAVTDPALLSMWIVPGADHGFWVSGDTVRGRHQSPALFEGMLAWIWRHVEPGSDRVHAARNMSHHHAKSHRE